MFILPILSSTEIRLAVHTYWPRRVKKVAETSKEAPKESKPEEKPKKKGKKK